MINFRYHVVSLTAVFLALALGVIIGIGFLGRATVEGLQSAQDTLSSRNKQLRKSILELQGLNERYLEFASEGEDRLLSGSLEGRPVALIVFDSIDETAVEQLEAAIVSASGNLQMSVSLSSTLDLATAARVQKLAEALGSDVLDASALREALISGVVSNLVGSTGGLFDVLAQAGFAEMRGEAVLRSGRLPPGTGLILVAPVTDRDLSLEEELLLPLVERLAGAKVPTTVGEISVHNLELLSMIREREVSVSSVDGVADPAGRVALMLALRQAYEGLLGHYGSGEGATAAIP